MSVRKRTWKTAKGEEKQAWIVDYVDGGGRRHLKTFERKKDADSYLATARIEVREGVHTADSQSVTVAEAAAKWIETCEHGMGDQPPLERSTVNQYRQHINLHIVPYLGRRKLSELSAPLIRDFGDKIRRGEPVSPDAASAPRSATLTKKILTSLGSLLGDAQERGLVSRNVVRDLRKKRIRGKQRRAERRQRGKLKVGVDIPAPGEIKAVVGALRGRWRPILLTAIFTGLRASELRGLRWRDVDIHKRELHVRQRADRYSAIGAPKSEAGERSVPLPPIVVNALREWKLQCPKSEAGLVFPSSGGLVEHHKNIVAFGLVPAMIAAGVIVRDEAGKPILDEDEKPKAKYSGLHALRHFYASWCINPKSAGGLELPAKVVQERLGHSSITMTMDVYGHLFPRSDDGAELAEAEKALLGLRAT